MKSSAVVFDCVTVDGKSFDVSTVRTFVGGAPDTKPLASPFSLSDYADETPWPFETMVFSTGSCTGLYHKAYATKEAALIGHRRIMKVIKSGLEFGGGVKGSFGTPSLTPDQWRAGGGRDEHE